VSFPNAIQVRSLHKWFSGRAHWEVACNPRAAAAYYKKEGNFLEFGVSPNQSHQGQGKRSDLDVGECCAIPSVPVVPGRWGLVPRPPVMKNIDESVVSL
jgi:hypothetical protein